MTPITDTDEPVGLLEALEMTLAHVYPLTVVRVPLPEGLNRVLSTDVRAKVDSPSLDTSLMDGYAVKSADISGASKERPKTLELAGTVAAGSPPGQVVESQQTIRVMTGGPIPIGADAVVPEEFVTPKDHRVEFHQSAESGSNILPRGSDLAENQVVARAGDLLGPGLLGMLAAAGHSRVQVVQPPRVVLIGTGDEVTPSGEPLPDGHVYASNITTLDGWCRHYGFGTQLCVVGDEPEDIYRVLGPSIDQADAVVTSGGAWTGDRDLVAQALRRLGWEQVFRGIRMVPGKGVGFGLLGHKPIFMLPGGPSANVTGFLQIALPGLLRLAGHGHTGLPEMNVRLAGELNGRHRGWTQFVFGTLERQGDRHIFHPVMTRSRLQAVAVAEAVVAIPEGETHLPAGTVVQAQVLDSLNRNSERIPRSLLRGSSIFKDE